ncbi:HdeD family acid-resistance protein [Estrella lausannensis]|uniref:Conserved putative membrane protein n=1 Tax=Estrella lausannensis TaxID=483423 RepID=A0A0H5E7W7_9BACT|nr:DUF308 domain-containing protein [Estrella lausannensis]CRX39430.1 Conserved putative membrane protein [Estrella lausannensis]
MIETLRKWKFLYTLEAILFIFLGLAAIVAPFIFTISFELLIGCLFLVGGVVQGVRSLKQGMETAGFWLNILVSLLSIFCGIYLLSKPIQGIIALTILLAIFFFFDGTSKIWLFFQSKDVRPRGWFLLSGILSFLIGSLIYFGLPNSSVWAIGTLVGVNLLMSGVALLAMIYGALKSH